MWASAQRLRERPELLPGGLAVALFVVLAASEGGFEATTWYPAALFVLALLAVVVAVLGRARMIMLSPGHTSALLLLAAFTAWTFLSILWAEVPGVSWEGANRTLLYLLVFALFAALPWSAQSGGILLGAHSVAIAVVALYTLGDLAASTDPELGLIRGRLVEPTGYQNATAALLLASFFPALLLASRREVPWWARGVLLAAAGILVEVAILPQSRGSVIVAPLVAIAFVALAPGRTRLVLTAVPVAVAALLAHQPLLDVYSVVVDGGDVRAAFDEAFAAVAVSAVALLAAGCGIGLIERRAVVPARVARATSRVLAALAVAGSVVGVVVALNATGNPVDWLDERWEDFKSGDPGQIEASSRFGGTLGSNRYDFWRVALDEFSDEPVTGVGMDQFAVDYVRERRSDEEPTNPHSLEVKILSQTGVVGAALLGAFLVLTVTAAVRVRVRAGDSLAGAVAAGGTIALVYWFVHGSADWFWEFPGLTMPVLAWIAIAGAVGPAGERARRRERPRHATRVALAAVVAITATAAVATLALPWGAARDTEIAAENWPADPDAAFERLDRARGLNPLDDTPDAVAGTIALRLGDGERALTYFEEAAERNPHNWYSQLMLGSLAATRGDRAEALRFLRSASELNPDDQLIRDAIAGARRGTALRPAAIDRELQLRVCARVGRTSATPECE